MSSIDKRIVQMQFDNQGFESGVKTTMNSLKNLNESLKMKGATNGLEEVNSGMKKITSNGMGTLASSVEAVTSKFSALGVIGVTALVNITNKAMEAGRRIVSALTIDPIRDGFSEYETKMNSIQTILTNTESKGTTLDDVTKALGELNTYADQTIYNFADMTKNIGTFTAAGVDLDKSVLAIKGIANLAAGSGSTPTQASTAMYQLSQALAAGRVNLMDWNSVVNAGMGGELFQNALKNMAKEMGIFVDESKPFRETLQDGWLTSDVLIATLNKFANDESLVKAATEVKTFTQLIDTMKESVGSGWATTWEHIIGNKEQAAELFTSISDGFNSIIKPSTDARNKMLQIWNENGGRTAVIEGLTNTVTSLGKVLGSIGSAWKEVFPSMTGEKLVEISNKFKDLTEKFKISDEAAGKIKATFKGLFDVIKLIKDSIVSVVKGFTPLGKIFDGVGSSVLNVASSFGKLLSNVAKSASKNGFFETITLGVKKASEAVGKFILGFKDGVKNAFSGTSKLDFSGFFDGITSGFKSVSTFLKPVMKGIGETIGSIDLNKALNLVKTGAAIKMVKALKDMFGEVADVAETTKGVIGSLKGIGSGIKDSLGALKDTLEQYQKDLQASTLIKIAGAIAILAGALMLLSSIDGRKMTTGLAGLAGIFVELTAAYVLMSKFGSFEGMFKLGSFMLGFSVAIGILSLALKSLSELNPEELMTGLIGIASTMLVALSAIKLMGKSNGKIISSATGLLIFASALHVMAGALEKIGSIDADTLGTGLSAIGLLLGELAIFMAAAKFGGLGVSSATGILILSAALLVLKEAVDGFGQMDPNTIITGLAGIAGILAEIALFSAVSSGGLKMASIGVGLTVIGAGLLVLSKALQSFTNMSWEEIGRGLTAMAGGLTILGVAAQLISGVKMTIVGAGIIVMSAAISLLSMALKSMGNMSWEEIGKGMVTLAGALTILSVAMYAMSGAMLGAAALVIVAGALAVLTPQLLLLSQMSLEGVGVALLGMAGAFTVLGLAGLILTPVVPTLLALAGAIALIGLGALACGAGLALVGTGLTAVGVAVGASGLLIVEFFRQLIKLLPEIGTKAGEAMVNFAKAIGEGGPQIAQSVTQVVSAILTSLSTLIPQVVDLAVNTVISFANGLAQGVPALVSAGLQLVLGVLQGISQNIQQIVETGADCVIKFMDGVANKLPSVIESGINLALSFIEGVADGLINNKERISSAIHDVVYAMLTVGVEALASGVSGFIEGGKELLQGAIDGVKSKWPDIVSAVKGAVDQAVSACSGLGNKLFSAGADLINGFMGGIKSKAQAVWDAAVGVGQKAIDGVKSILGIASPSKVFRQIGKFTVQGMSVGLDKYTYMAEQSASGLANKVIDNVRNPLSNLNKILNGEIDTNPKITPVLDLSDVKKGSRLLSSIVDDNDLQINARSSSIARTVGKIQNGNNNDEIVEALKDLKDNLNNGNQTYTINGITYDDGSNISEAVQTLVRAARIERRL